MPAPRAPSLCVAGGLTAGTPTTITADPPVFGSTAPSLAAVSQARTETINAVGLDTTPGAMITAPTPASSSIFSGQPSSAGANAGTLNLQVNSFAASSSALESVFGGGGGIIGGEISGGISGAFSGVSSAFVGGSISDSLPAAQTGSSNTGGIGAAQTSIVDGNDANTATQLTRTLYGQATEYGVPEQCRIIGNDSSQVDEIEAALIAGSCEMGIAGPRGPKSIEMSGWTSPQTKVMTLRKGNVVVAPDQDTVIETSFGTVEVAAKSVALIIAMPSGTAVYNLDDSRKNSIVLHIGKDHMTLAPGRHAMITSHLVDSFEMVNPAESFGYRNLSSTKLDGDLKAFTSEYSMTNAIANIKQLRAMFNSDHPQAKKVASLLHKTAAIMSQISGGGYQQYQHPRMTAMSVVK